MFRLIAVTALTLAGLLAWTLPAHAAADGVVTAPGTFSDQDTAVYVVSTLNLVRTGDRQSLVSVLTERYGAVRFAVWEDLVTQTFVIEAKRADGSNAAMLVYRLGWDKPYSYSRLTAALGVPRSPRGVEGHFRSHAKRLLGSFSSTLP